MQSSNLWTWPWAGTETATHDRCSKVQEPCLAQLYRGIRTPLEPLMTLPILRWLSGELGQVAAKKHVIDDGLRVATYCLANAQKLHDIQTLAPPFVLNDISMIDVQLAGQLPLGQPCRLP